MIENVPTEGVGWVAVDFGLRDVDLVVDSVDRFQERSSRIGVAFVSSLVSLCAGFHCVVDPGSVGFVVRQTGNFGRVNSVVGEEVCSDFVVVAVEDYDFVENGGDLDVVLWPERVDLKFGVESNFVCVGSDSGCFEENYGSDFGLAVGLDGWGVGAINFAGVGCSDHPCELWSVGFGCGLGSVETGCDFEGHCVDASEQLRQPGQSPQHASITTMDTKREPLNLGTNLFLLVSPISTRHFNFYQKPFSDDGIQWRLFKGPWDVLVEFYLTLLDHQILCVLRPNEIQSEVLLFSNEKAHLNKGTTFLNRFQISTLNSSRFQFLESRIWNLENPGE